MKVLEKCLHGTWEVVETYLKSIAKVFCAGYIFSSGIDPDPVFSQELDPDWEKKRKPCDLWKSRDEDPGFSKDSDPDFWSDADPEYDSIKVQIWIRIFDRMHIDIGIL